MGNEAQQLPDGHPAVAAFRTWKAKADPLRQRTEELDSQWAAFSAGFEAAPRVPRFNPIQRNFQAIAILALAASGASLDQRFNPPWDEVPDETQRESVDAVIRLARGEKVEAHPVFLAVARTALDMYDGHGGLAIEHLVDLGEFMINEMGYEPAEDTPILDSLKAKMIEMRDYIEANEAAKAIARKALADSGGDVGKASEDVADQFAQVLERAQTLAGITPAKDTIQ